MNFLESRLKKRADLGLLRTLSKRSGGIDLTSNDYFGFARESREHSAPGGASGSRLLTGNSRDYEKLEERIAQFHRAESCLIYNNGYMANLGLLSSLGEGTFLYDLEIHASMIDGMRLGEVKSLAFRHNDLVSLEWRLKKAAPPVFVLIESLYSMSGDFAPLKEIVQLCEEYGAHLIVDEAHATGLFGSAGEGLVESKVFARVHTFSQALGAHGACVLGSRLLKEMLINFSRPLIYTTALPPSALQQISWSYEKLAREGVMHRAKLQTLIAYFCKKTGRPVSLSPIQPFVTGNAKELSERLWRRGIDVRAIISPTVGRGKECLRIVLHSFNEESEIDQLLEVL